MYELKLRATDIDPMQVISAVPNEKKQADAKTLLSIFQKVTGEKPVVWGEKQIGFGCYKYRYASGHQGELYCCGFAVTKRNLTLYLYLEEPVLHSYLEHLGKAKAGKSCVYINKLADVDVAVLEEMLAEAIRYVRTLEDGAATV